MKTIFVEGKVRHYLSMIYTNEQLYKSKTNNEYK